LGDVHHFVLNLASQKCQSFSNTYKDVPVGIITSWAFVDTLTLVKESDEENNRAGPLLVLVPPSTHCMTICPFSIGCGVFNPLQIQQCFTWCEGLNFNEQQCAQDAVQQLSCDALKKCVLPAPPPPPPPPWECLTLCDYLVNQCKLLPANQFLTCTGMCLTLPVAKLECALKAKEKHQCLEMSLCLFK